MNAEQMYFRGFIEKNSIFQEKNNKRFIRLKLNTIYMLVLVPVVLPAPVL
jgi:hypothetical protein